MRVFRTSLCYKICPLLLILFFTSCRKIVFEKSGLEKSEQYVLTDADKTKFFAYTSSVERPVKRVLEQMRLENERSGFLAKFIKREGFAKWDKALVKESRQSRPSDGSDSNKVSVNEVLIPLVYDDSSFVHAALSCKVTSDSIYISLLDSRFYDKEDPSLNNSLKGRRLSLLLMQLDQEVFGHNLFSIQDSAAFESRRDNVKMVRLTNGDDSLTTRGMAVGGRLVSYTLQVCYIVYVPVNQGQLTGCPPDKPCPQYTEERRCEYYTGWYDDGTTSSLPPITPTTGGGTGGSGGYTTPPTAPPCPSSPVPRHAGRLSTDCPPGYLPVFDESWFNSLSPVSIDLSLLNNYPCTKQIAIAVSNLNNSTMKTIKGLFNETAKFNLRFSVDPTLPANKTATTSSSPNFTFLNGTYGKLVFLNIDIKLNPNFLLNATKMSIAESIIHEMIHAYFYYRSVDAAGNPTKELALSNELGFLKPYNPNVLPITYGNQHEQMAASFIDKIVASLKEFKLISSQDLAPLRNTYPTIDVDSYYRAMAWAGLNGTVEAPITKAWEVFKSKNPSLAAMYEGIISTEENGTELAPSKTKCN